MPGSWTPRSTPKRLPKSLPKTRSSLRIRAKDSSMQVIPRGHVYKWKTDSGNPSGGRVSLSIEPLLRLDAQREKDCQLSGRYVLVRNGGAVNEKDSATGGVRAVPIGNAQPHSDGDFFFEPGRGG